MWCTGNASDKPSGETEQGDHCWSPCGIQQLRVTVRRLLFLQPVLQFRQHRGIPVVSGHPLLSVRRG